MNDTLLESANGLMRQGNFEGALNSFEQVLAMSPQTVDAWAGTALCYTTKGQWLEAVNAIINALGYGGYQQKELVILIQILEACQLNSHVEPVEKALHYALEHQWLEGQAIELLVVQLLAKYQNILNAPTITLDEDVEKMLLDPTLCAVVERVILPHHGLETVLLLARSELLKCIAHNQDVRHYLPIMVAIACQNLLNDGLYSSSEEDQKHLDMLDDADQVYALECLALRLCYAEFEQAIMLWRSHQSLFKFKKMQALATDLAFYAQLANEAEREAMAETTSERVQSFYMENPYPKYKVVRVNSASVGQTMSRIGLENIVKPNILVAGCGTGLQAIEMAFANRDGKVLAIDISPTSLEYAKLMATRYQLENIEFKQLDILDLESLGQYFDYIVCTGVLHHMASPQAGLDILSRVLRPQRAMVLGFYSRSGRQDLTEIRQQVLTYLDKPQEQVVKQALSQWRANWSEQDKKQHWFNTNDFFNLNGLMDAIFHPQEAYYDLNQIKRMLHDAQVTFKSMAITPSMRAKYAQPLSEVNLPYNVETLTFWHGFERKHPYFFADMYNFFVVKA